MQTFAGAISATYFTWIFLVFPWVGAIAAVFFYECVFKRAQAAVETGEAIHEAADGLIDPDTKVNDP